MEKKLRGWKEGTISEDLHSVGGTTFRKGDTVRYKRYKSLRGSDGFLLTEYEWHYVDTNNYNLIRADKRIIEGLPIIKEQYL